MAKDMSSSTVQGLAKEKSGDVPLTKDLRHVTLKCVACNVGLTVVCEEFFKLNKNEEVVVHLQCPKCKIKVSTEETGVTREKLTPEIIIYIIKNIMEKFAL